MLLKDYGFRPVYHNICVFELNDKLRDLIKACPDAAKSSHAVCYGYIDAKKGLMLEVLCGGKQAPKYFYFKDVYEGERITIPASELKDVEFDVFENLEPRFRKKLNPRIEPLKKYDAPEGLEKTRGQELGFLDAFRDLQHPDVVRVSFIKDGLQVEEVPVRVTGTGDHCIVGVVQKKPKQDFGPVKGDTISFNARQTEDNRIEIYLDLNVNEPHELTQADLEDGGFLKYCITEFLKDTQNQEAFGFLLAVLRSSSVVVPCDIELNEESKAIVDKLEAEGKSIDDLDGEEGAKFAAGMIFHPRILENESEDSDVEGLELEDPNADVENNTINAMLLDQLKEYLADLDEADRIFILTLFSFKNKQVTRTSEIYGCTERITAYRRDRIIEKLQAKFFGKFYGNN